MFGVGVAMSFGDELLYGVGMGAAIILTCSLFPILADTIASAICKIKIGGINNG